MWKSCVLDFYMPVLFQGRLGNVFFCERVTCERVNDIFIWVGLIFSYQDITDQMKWNRWNFVWILATWNVVQVPSGNQTVCDLWDRKILDSFYKIIKFLIEYCVIIYFKNWFYFLWCNISWYPELSFVFALKLSRIYTSIWVILFLSWKIYVSHPCAAW